MRHSLYILFVVMLGFFTSCASDDTNSIETNNIESKIKGKWFFHSEVELDPMGNIISSFDLREIECNSGTIIFQNNNKKDEFHADIDENCEIFNFDGTWSYNESANIIIFTDEEDGYTTKGTVEKINSQELHIRILQQGDDSDFSDFNTHLILKRSL